MQQSLQRQVAQLAVDNEMLKGIVKHRFEDQHVKTQVLSNCRTESLPPILATGNNTTTSTTGASGSGGSPTTTKVIEKSDFGLMAAIQAAQRSFCITDPSLPDNPIGKNYDPYLYRLIFNVYSSYNVYCIPYHAYKPHILIL